MANLIQNLRAAIPDSISNLSNHITPMNLGSVLSALNNVFKNSISSCSSFASAFASEWDKLDAAMLKSSFAEGDQDKFFETDSRDLADTLSSVVTRFGITEDLGGILGEKKTITITTTNGVVLKLFTMGQSVYSFDGRNSYAWPVAVRISEGGPIQTHKTRVYYILHGVIVTGDVSYVVLVDLLSDLMENAAISNVLSQTVTTLLNGGSDTATDLLNLASCIDAKWDSVRSLCTQIYTAWNVGGVYGVIRCILDVIKGVPSVTVGEDGFLTFTDAGGLMPQAYTAGIIQVIGTVVSAIAAAIVSIWSPVVGFITASLGSLITSLVSAYKYNENVGENASMNDSVKCVGGLAPHFMARAKINLSAEHYEDLLSNCPFMEIDNVVLLPVPGGSIIAVAGGDGKVSYEFHPDIVDRIDWMLESKLIGDANVSIDNAFAGYFDATIDPDVLLEGLKTGKVPVFGGQTCKRFDHWKDQDPYVFSMVNFQNSSSGALTPEQTQYLGLVVGANCILFEIYLLGLIGVDWTYGGILRKTRDWCYGILHDDNGNSKLFYYSGVEEFPVARSWMTLFGSLLSMATLIFNIINNKVTIQQAITSCGDPFTVLANMSEACSRIMGEGDVSSSDTGLYDSFTVSGTSVEIAARNPFGYYVNYSASSYEACVSNLTGGIIPLSSDLEFIFSVPKYKPGSVLLGTIKAAIIVALSIAVVAVVSVIAVKKIRQHRAMNAVRAEQAWENLKENPTAENYNAYAKAVRKNNAFAHIFGGSLLSKSGYWDSSSGSASTSVTTLYSKVSEQMFTDGSSGGLTLRSEDELSTIVRLITGVSA